MSSQDAEDELPAPPPDYPRSYRKLITEGKHAGRICCTLCNRRIDPSKIDRHDGGESKLHNKKLAEKYAKELRQIREECFRQYDATAVWPVSNIPHSQNPKAHYRTLAG